MSFKKGDKVKIPTRKSISGQSDIKYFREKLDRMKVYPDFLVVDHVIDNEVTLYIKELGYSPKFLSSDLELFDGIAVAAAEDKLKYRMCDFSSFSEGCGVKVLNSRGMFEGVAFLRGTTWYVATNNPIGDGHNALPEEYKQYAFVWKLGSLIDQASHWSYGTIEVQVSNSWGSIAGSDETKVLYNSIPLKKNLLEKNTKFNELLLIG